MVLKKLVQKKPVEPEGTEEYEEVEEPDYTELDKEKERINQRLKNLDNPKPVKKSKLRIVDKEQIPYQRLETVQGENGEIYEVITKEEALEEILSILRENQ